MHKRTLFYLTALSLCLFAGAADAQDWLVGGYVSSFGPYDGDPSIAGLKKWLDYPIPTYSWYGMNGSVYYLPYSVYSPYSAAYYPTPGWTPLYAAGWQVYQQDWAKTLEYAQTKSSIRVYPRQSITYTSTQTTAAPAQTATPTAQYTAPTAQYTAPTAQYTAPTAQYTAPTAQYTTPTAPTATSGDSTAIIISQGMRGYQVFLDGVYIGTEGTGGDPLDGRFTFKVTGNRNHEVRVYDGQFNYPKIMFFDYGGTKTVYVEPGTAVYI